MLLKHGLHLKLMSGGYVCLKEKCFDVFSERNKRNKYGGKDIIMNYTKYLMIQILSITSNLKYWHGQGT
jgi:hypothetical protein